MFLYAPSRGSGMKIKILEAMAFGVPVVTTGEGVEGLPAVDGVHAGVCEDDAGLIERHRRPAGRPRPAEPPCRAARRLIETFCGRSDPRRHRGDLRSDGGVAVTNRPELTPGLGGARLLVRRCQRSPGPAAGRSAASGPRVSGPEWLRGSVRHRLSLRLGIISRKVVG